MNEFDKTQAVKNWLHLITMNGDALWAYNEMETMLIQLSGYDMRKLIELFAAGYTLEPPRYSVEKLSEIFSGGVEECIT